MVMVAETAKGVSEVTEVTATIVGGGGCSGGVYRSNTGGHPCEFWYSLTCGSSTPDIYYQNLLQGPTTYNGGYISISPAYSQNQTCTLYGSTSGECQVTVYYDKPSSRTANSSTARNEYYTTLSAPDFNPVRVTAIGESIGLLSSVASCVSARIAHITTVISKTSDVRRQSLDVTRGTGANSKHTSVHSQDLGGLSVGQKAGIGVGVGVGFVLLIGLGFFLVIRRARRGAGNQHIPTHEPNASKVIEIPGDQEMAVEIGQSEKEMPTGKEAHEMASEAPVSELATQREGQ